MCSSDLLIDTNESALYVGCSNHFTDVFEHKFYGEVDVSYLTIILNTSDINKMKDLYETESFEISKKEYYKNILCLYNFKRINNLGIVYDESKNTNFLERAIIYQ